MPDRIPVLIVGGGPVGLSLALGLARCGVQSVVIEKNPSTSEKSRAPGIWSRTLEIFDGWEVIDRFLAAGPLLSEVKVWTVGSPEPQVEVSFEYLRETTPYPGLLVVPQSRTEAILAERLEEDPLANVRFSCELLDWTEDDDGIVARVATPRGEERIAASYLVGCDGAHSAVRHGLGLHLEGKTYDAHVALADVQIDGQEFDWPRVGFSDGPLIGLHLGHGLWRIIAISSAAASDKTINDAELDEWVRGVFGDVAYQRIWTSTFQIHERLCKTLRVGRVLLAGDAGHLNSPAGGQGMNSGIQDAHNLAWKLASTLAGGNADKLLDSYDLERRQVIAQYVNRTTDFLTRAFVEGGSLRRSLFATVARSGLTMQPVRRRAMRRMTMLDPRYRKSPLFPSGHRLVGRRAPNCAVEGVEGVERLHQLVRSEPCLLLLNGAARVEIDGVRQEKMFPATAPALFEELGEIRKTAVLLRPDGFIGLVMENPSSAELKAAVAAALGRN